MAFADGFNLTYAIKEDIQIMTNTEILLKMCTDILSLFDKLTKAAMQTEKRLMIDLNFVKNAYDNDKINDLYVICSEFNIAAALTKRKKIRF